MRGPPTMFGKVLIANRGEIACRIMKTARRMGIRCIAVYSDAEKNALHVGLADEAYRLGPPPALQSYLAINRIIDIARKAGAEAIHPGYGFLSENSTFAEACREAGVVFIGPPTEALRSMGLKDNAKRLMERAGIPVVPGYHGERTDADFLHERAREIGYPVLIKASAGGGGRGMRRVDDPDMLGSTLEAARREAEASFGDGRLIIEKFLPKARHIEFQVFADAQRENDPPVRARLLAAAPVSEGDRGGAGAWHDASTPSLNGRGGRQGRDGHRLCRSWNGRVHR